MPVPAEVQAEFDDSLGQYVYQLDKALDKRFGLALPHSERGEPTHKGYDPNEERDEKGRWTSGAGGADYAKDPSVADRLQEAQANQVKDISPEARDAALVYIGNGMAINNALRHPEYGTGPRLDEQLAKMEVLSGLINQATVPEDTYVYRGIHDASGIPAAIAMRERVEEGSTIGTTMTDKGFLSTSLDSKLASEFAKQAGAVVRIKVPEGSNALYLSEHVVGTTEHRGETLVPGGAQSELVLGRSTSIRITGIRWNERVIPGAKTGRKQRLVIDAELV